MLIIQQTYFRYHAVSFVSRRGGSGGGSSSQRDEVFPEGQRPMPAIKETLILLPRIDQQTYTSARVTYLRAVLEALHGFVVGRRAGQPRALLAAPADVAVGGLGAEVPLAVRAADVVGRDRGHGGSGAVLAVVWTGRWLLGIRAGRATANVVVTLNFSVKLSKCVLLSCLSVLQNVS